MGVMTCSRNGCSNIMFDTYISKVGYVCLDCQEEFKKYLEIEKIEVKTESQIESALEKFMDTDQGTYNKEDKEIGIDEFFRQYTR